NLECCGNPELSVMISGDIANKTYAEIEDWIKSQTDLPFIHVYKRHDLEFGHIHFASHEDACNFLHDMSKRPFRGLNNEKRKIKISESTYFGSRVKVDYGTVLNKKRKIQDSPRETIDYLNNHSYDDNDQYRLYEDTNGQKYKLVLHTPGAKTKTQLKVTVEEEGIAVTVECEVIKQAVSETKLYDSIKLNSFRTRVKFPQ
ncbi:25350_t:CDS:2, partial [Racocetra persica]